ncbi:MAG: N-acetyltransferase family protein [Microcella sp.]
MTATVRTATGHDADLIARVHLATWIETYRSQLPDQFFGEAALEHRRRMWTWMLGEGASPTQRIAVAERDGEIVGFASSGPPLDDTDRATGASTQLYTLYVLAAHHGTGVGQRLLDAVIDPDASVVLWVAKRNPRAQSFYRRNRFRFDGVVKPDERVPSFLEARMVRKISE